MAIKLGTPVRQIVPAPVAGIVMRKEWDNDTEQFRFLVEWPDPEGEEPHSRWFNEDDIEAQGE